MTFKEKWLHSIQLKKTQLCVGLDPAEHGQKAKNTLPQGADKLKWCLQFIDAVEPYASAVKINRNFIKDLSRKETQKLCRHIHDYDMVIIDDAKLCDVGSSNDAGFYHAAEEGFDAITYSPFPGNIEEATTQAHAHDLGIIVLVLMSNPQFRLTKQNLVNGIPFYEHYCHQIVEAGADGVVIGAISPDNHLSENDVVTAGKKLKDQIVLVPGLGEQGGNISVHLHLFKERTIINVGRSILFAQESGAAAKAFRDEIWRQLV
jgi:orotidine-5'-phosphate decarboxylase